MNKNFFFFLFVSLLAQGYIFAQTSLPQPMATIVLPSKVKGQNLTDRIKPDEFQTRVNAEERSLGRTLSAAQRKQLLDAMVDERLILLAAQRDGIAVSDADINRQVEALRANLSQQLGGRQPTAEEFAQAVRNSTGGLSVDEFRTQLKNQAIVNRYILAKKPNFEQTLMNMGGVTQADIDKEYNDNKTTRYTRKNTALLSMIQVPIGQNARQKAKDLADKLARDIGQDLSKFDDAVLQGGASDSLSRAGYNAGPQLVTQDADTRRVFGNAFVDTTFSLAQGKVSPVIEAGESFVIFKIIANYAAKILGLNEIFQIGSPVTVQEFIRMNLARERQQDFADRTTKELVDAVKKEAQITKNQAP